MRKTVIMLLIAVMILSLAACAANPAPVPSKPTTPPATQPTAAPTEPTAAPTEPTTAPTEPTTAPTEPTTVPTEPVTVPTEPEKEYNFTSTLLKLKAYFDEEEWLLMDDDDLKEINGGENAPSLDEAVALFVLYGVTEDGTSVNIVLENTMYTGGISMTESEYASVAKGMLGDALTQAGLTNVKVKAVDMTVAGTDHPALAISGKAGDTTIYETIVIIKAGDIIASLTVSSTREEHNAEILNLFEAL